MSVWDLGMNEEVFPDAKRFVSERWIEDVNTADGTPLERYFVGFGKGDTSCLGVNLAKAELILRLGTVYLYFGSDLFETDKFVVELAHHFFLGSSGLDSNGVQVQVRNADENTLQRSDLERLGKK
ncbi:hypothetical protein B0J12DRAFT_724939 [Macrophomina phaseolina]|uniref:Cytochrome P450 n=1 Tax=Macrophomina phaseolina TaxID=35725 RepID=A0ABQ8GNL1_9PEZI|nr:hypothetical protein B0J12DRAFT_724939 [Macrophomina phaseolina]